MLLQKKIPDSLLGPVRAEAGPPGWVKDLNTITNRCNDRIFGGLEGSVQFIVPIEWLLFCRQKWTEGCHDVSQLGIVGNLINEAKPAPDVGR